MAKKEEKKLNKKSYNIAAYMVVILIFTLCGFLYSCTSKKENVYLVENGTQKEKEQADDVLYGTHGKDFSTQDDIYGDAASDSTSARVFVYVCGNVARPGVYEAAEDARVYELIDMAGGVTDKGCLEALNLAEHIYDGQKLYVPDYEEYEDNGSISYNDVDSDGRQKSETGKVNINNADLELLMTLPGIGKSRAQAIIDYRSVNGVFGNIEDIMSVSGIKESAFSKIKDYICVK